MQGKGIELEFDARMHSRVVAVFEGRRIEIGPLSASETVRTAAGELSDFAFVDHAEEAFSDAIGTGRRHRLVGRGADLEKTLEILLYDEWPQVAVVQATYSNSGTQDVVHPVLGAEPLRDRRRPRRAEPAFWSYQSGSYEKRPDWVLPVPRGFRQENYLGMNATDYGGGTPVVDVWRRDVGLAVGHLELTPKNVFLPVSRQTRDRAATLGVRAALAADARARGAVHDAEDLRRRASGRLLPGARRVPAAHAPAGDSTADGAAQRVRADLVRLGLRTRIHDGPGPLDPASGPPARLRLGHARRRMAGRRGRLDAGPREVSAGRRRT